MQAPSIPSDEAARLTTLLGLHILDSEPEERFDRLTRLAYRIFNVPIALVGLIDGQREWFKSRIGLVEAEMSRADAFCAHTILGEGPLVVPDASLDERFHDNPFVAGPPFLRFYAGFPLHVGNSVGRSGIGTFCVMDTQAREFNDESMATLRDLARMAEHELSAVRLAITDELTGLSNRHGFEALAMHALSLARRMKTPTALLSLEVDDLEAIDRLRGRADGDAALKSFAELLIQAFRNSDVVGRLGADKFAVLLTNIAPGTLPVVLGRLRQGVERHNAHAHIGFDLKFSVGSVMFDAQRHHGVGEMVADADKLMRMQRASARPRVRA